MLLAAPVSEHASPASDEVKRQIREWLGRGMTRQQVLDAFVERYGARILAEPPNKGAGRYLYLAPWLVFGLSAIGLVVLVKKLTASRAAAAPAAGTAAAPFRARARRPGSPRATSSSSTTSCGTWTSPPGPPVLSRPAADCRIQERPGIA